MMRRLGLLSVGLLLAGCATTSAPPPPPPAAISSLDGVAQFRVTGDRAATCSGFSVAMWAETARSRDRMQTLYGSAEHAIEPVGVVKARTAGLPPGDPPIGSASCDAEGVFAFSSVEPGAYYLLTHLKIVPGKPSDELVLLQRVVVRPGEARHVRLVP